MKFKFDFIKNSKTCYIISSILILAIIVGSLIIKVDLDIQFKGGSMIKYAYTGDISAENFDAKATEILGTNVNVQAATDIATDSNIFIMAFPGEQSIDSESLVEFNEKINEAFPGADIYSLEINNVDPAIGREFFAKSIVAMMTAIILVLLYVAFRFRKIGGLSAGAMGVLALMHDCIVAYGVFVFFRIPLDDNFIAVILTILGFSLNDTIVIYDRIRENRRLYGGKTPIAQLVNDSINQSITRAVYTSLCGIIAMVVVTIVALAFGVRSILSFSFPLMIGLVCGTYTSICLTGPLWVKWQERKLAKAR